jgi:diadenosine tetraphosphate (Ap4A) HIT family hydrolase
MDDDGQPAYVEHHRTLADWIGHITASGMTLTALTEPEWLDLRTQMARLTAAVTALWQPDRFNHAFLMNADAQVHLHVVPRYRAARSADLAALTAVIRSHLP